MGKRIKCVLMLSLKEMALRRVAVLLTNDSRISSTYNAEWKEWQDTHEDKVKNKISKLHLPESLRKEMMDKVRPIRLEIQKWRECLPSLLPCSVEIGFEKLYWTPAGTIEYKKTAEALLDCETLDVETRYILSSVYCLEDFIPRLWEELDEDRKECFCIKTSVLSWVEVCWPRILEGDFTYLNRLWRTSDRNLTSFNQWAFESSAREMNKTSAEYFIKKMTHEEREASLMRTSLDVLSELGDSLGGWCFPDICCFLLSSMTPEQQMQTIKEQPVPVLCGFCMMFWQDLLVENACLVWPFISESDYDDLLGKILGIVQMSDFYHVKSFREFFLTSPADFKKYFVRHESMIFGKLRPPAYSFICTFISKYDSESIECIFRNVEDADKTALVFHPAILELLWETFNPNDINSEKRIPMAKVCLREAKLSKEDRERLKECPRFRRVIEELYESHATADKVKKGRKRKLENFSSK